MKAILARFFLPKGQSATPSFLRGAPAVLRAPG